MILPLLTSRHNAISSNCVCVCVYVCVYTYLAQAWYPSACVLSTMRAERTFLSRMAGNTVRERRVKARDKIPASVRRTPKVRMPQAQLCVCVCVYVCIYLHIYMIPKILLLFFLLVLHTYTYIHIYMHTHTLTQTSTNSDVGAREGSVGGQGVFVWVCK